MVDKGIISKVAICFIAIPWLIAAQHTFPLFDLFSYLFHVDVWKREYGLCVASYVYPSETASHGLLLESS